MITAEKLPNPIDFPSDALIPLYEGLKVTREEYLDLPEDGFKYDMIDGVLTMAPSAEFTHGGIAVKIAFLIQKYLNKNKIGELVSEIDILLPDGGDVLRPDLCFLKTENLKKVKKHIHCAPDLVVEILSQSTSKRDLGIKAERYLKNGVIEYWIADPDKKSLEIWLNEKKSWKKLGNPQLESRIFPGIKIKLKDIFE